MELSNDETSILQKGLGYVPEATKVDAFQTLADTEHFFRKIRLTAHFAEKTEDLSEEKNDTDQIPKFEKNPSLYTPPQGEYEAVDSYINTCRQQMKNIDMQKQGKPENISKKEIAAIRSLKNRDDIVIRQADKGGAVCVWEKSSYIAEGETQLSDGKFYKQQDKDTTADIQKRLTKEVKTMIKNGELPPSAENLLVKAPRCAQFYLLPKIHKPDVPGRPVVSNISCPTYYISKFLSKILRPIVEKCPTYIKDTNHLLQTIDNFEFPDSEQEHFLFTMDVKGLYTNIPNKDGLEALEYYLNQRKDMSIPTQTLVRLEELVLTNNCMEFNGKFYSQIGGTMMGTPFGVEYSCLFMSHEEKKISQEYTDELPILHKRFIDDIFGAASMSMDKLRKYLTFIENHHPALQYIICHIK